ncbi:MAG TPA: hypothetical protein VG993_12245 [Actinomycetota bacterium]|nr:hypothetical protein [Actinomycetota bacterium]
MGKRLGVISAAVALVASAVGGMSPAASAPRAEHRQQYTDLAATGLADADDTPGPLDIKWLHLEQTGHRHRLRLTVSFWPGFRPGALAGDPNHGLRVEFRLPDVGESSEGYTIRKNGRLRFRHGDFGSSGCCYSTPLIRLGPRRLTAVFVPWWIRGGFEEEVVVYWARTRVCRDPCAVDHTHRGVVA